MITSLRFLVVAVPVLLLAGCGFANAGPPPVPEPVRAAFEVPSAAVTPAGR